MIVLSNEHLELKILRRGVTFVSFKSKKDDINIITAFKNHDQYQDNDVYLGSLIGPLAGRTAPNSYGLDLDINNPPNHLHGGEYGLSTQRFDVTKTMTAATFTKTLDAVDYKVKVELKGSSVILDMHATPSTKTPFNLTNHMYFNLLGTQDLKAHQVKLKADKVSYISKNMVNTNDLRDVKGTLFDLNEWVKVEDLLQKTHPQFAITRHIDHSFLSQKVVLKADNKHLTIDATTPFMHLYFANYFDEGFTDEKGRKAKNHASMAIEPQYLPNDKNMPIYDAHHPYHETITYTLKVD